MIKSKWNNMGMIKDHWLKKENCAMEIFLEEQRKTRK
jgi:hypothetical protein